MPLQLLPLAVMSDRVTGATTSTNTCVLADWLLPSTSDDVAVAVNVEASVIFTGPPETKPLPPTLNVNSHPAPPTGRGPPLLRKNKLNCPAVLVVATHVQTPGQLVFTTFSGIAGCR